MNSKTLTANIGLVLTALAASSTALAEDYEDYARVRNVAPQYERVNAPRQECSSEYIQGGRRNYERTYGGSIIGGIAGAIIGNQVGNGHGKEAATAMGAITGAIVGDRLEHDDRYEDSRGREMRRCRNIDHWENRLTGYRVTYEYAGHTYTNVMPNDPGRELRVRVAVDPY